MGKTVTGVGSKIRTVLEFRRRHGLLSTLTLVGLQPLWSLGLFRAGHILCLRPEWCKLDQASEGEPVEHRFLTDSEIADLRDPARTEFPRYVSDLGIARGDPCFGCFVTGQLASLSWLAETPFVQWGSFLLFPEKHAFSHSRFTLHRFRGRRLQARSASALVQAIDRRGLIGLLGTVDVTNPASLKGARKAGYRQVGSVIQLGSRKHVFTYLSPAARRFGFSIGEEEETASD